AEMTPPPGFAETDPVIVHYHHLVGDDERLMGCPYPEAQKRIDAFNERLGAPAGTAGTGVRDARPPMVVLGMHRSGTSVVAEILHAMGAYAGRSDELMPPDLFNPTGYWEHL